MTMPAGTYYIGDLCYVLDSDSRDVWKEVVELTFPNGSDDSVEGEKVLSDGRRFACYGTAFGDGEYPASNGTRLCVDSGRIGCIRVSDLPEGVDTSSGTVVDFDRPFNHGSDGGVIRFGGMSIDTDGSDDDDDDF